MSVVTRKVEEMLRAKGYDMKIFKEALESGKGKRRVMEDIAIGNKVPIMGTPSIIVNGDFISQEFNEHVLERYLRK
jgi:predicted DsbA family dithiol-disulfide isomerase